MRLVYAVLSDPARYKVRITDEKPQSVIIYELQGMWDNGYSGSRPFGQFAWWKVYLPGTVIGVYDADNTVHLSLLANLVSYIKDADEAKRNPGRETPI